MAGRVLVAGEINADLLFVGYETFPAPGREILVDDFRTALGSASGICAMGLARLGTPVRFAGCVGNDLWGEYCLDVLRTRGIDVSSVRVDPVLKTGITASISAASDRALVTYPGAIAALTAADVTDDLLRGASHLHVSSYFLQRGLRPGCRDLFARASGMGLTTSLDPGFDPAERWDADLLELLALVDLFFPNEIELAAVTQKSEVSEALGVLNNGRTLTVAKLGSRGAMTRVNGKVLSVPAFRVDTVDTTGAGDSFNAGFLHAWLRGEGLDYALRLGCACGALATQRVGGTAGQPTLGEAVTFLERQAHRVMEAEVHAAFSRVAEPSTPASAQSGYAPAGKKQPLDLNEFRPRSMLYVRETRIERARFAVIDFHTHLGWSKKWQRGIPLSEEVQFFAPVETLLPVMDRKNVRMMVNLTGGHGRGIAESIAQFEGKAPGRFLTFVEPSWSRIAETGYSNFQAEEIARAKRAGARGLKVLKTLGLYIREQVTNGPLVRVDDKRFDATWEACGALDLPVAVHVADPESFFLPADRFNERLEELTNHPDWSFHDCDFPSFRELMEALYRVVARHPRTNFVALHVGGNAENLQFVSEQLERYPNLYIDIAARIAELGRQPRSAKKLFDRHQDRILFGTDAVPTGLNMPQQLFGDQLYEIYYRFLETEDEYFDYAPAPVPPQGRWKIYGLGLSETILRKVYYENAARLLRIND